MAKDANNGQNKEAEKHLSEAIRKVSGVETLLDLFWKNNIGGPSVSESLLLLRDTLLDALEKMNAARRELEKEQA